MCTEQGRFGDEIESWRRVLNDREMKISKSKTEYTVHLPTQMRMEEK